MPNKTKREEIREEFDKIEWTKGLIVPSKTQVVVDKFMLEKFWQFINSTLDTQLNNIIAELEGKSENPQPTELDKAYKSALSTAIKIVKKYGGKQK